MLPSAQLAIVPLLLFCACGSHGASVRPYPTPTHETLLGQLQSRQEQIESYYVESRMEYWVNKERIKPTVLVMGKRGAYIRVNALQPNGDVAADLACDGSRFQFVNYNEDCQLTGPCTEDAISQLLRVHLQPDDFLLLAVGSTPVISANEVTVHWDKTKGAEVLTLKAADGRRQVIVLDGHSKRWDVLSSTVRDAEGVVEWELTNKDFRAHKGEDGVDVRLPQRTRFRQPKEHAELTIRWEDAAINLPLSSDKFTIPVPALPRCVGTANKQKSKGE